MPASGYRSSFRHEDDDMGHPVSGIDHCYLMVLDLDRSCEQFRRLGFTVSARGLHSKAKGSANHTIMLSNADYFELLGFVAETEDNRPRLEMLRRDGEGLYAMACRVEDAERAKASLARLGIGTTDVQRFERPLQRADGGQASASFSVLHFARETVPFAVAFMCQHHTPELVWQPQLMHHANTAVCLAGAMAACADPEATAHRYARLFADGAVTEQAGEWRVRTGSVPISFLDRSTLANRYAELDVSPIPPTAFAVLQIAVRDLDAVRRLLAANGVRHQITPTGIAADPSEASGAIIEFRDAAAHA
jgi:hypothetical protein